MGAADHHENRLRLEPRATRLRRIGAGVLSVHLLAVLVLCVITGSLWVFLMVGLVPGALGIAVWLRAVPGFALRIVGLAGLPGFFVAATVGEASKVEATLFATAISAAPIVAGLLFVLAEAPRRASST
ncbi:MAG: hypothetical protein ACR2OD_08310 [Gaiellaceae bacterium]